MEELIMDVSIKELINLFNHTNSHLELENLWSHIEAAVEELAIEAYPNEYETSLHYDEDYVASINARREAFKKGYMSALDNVILES